MSEVSSYKDLIAWQKAYQLVLAVYRATAGFPESERFGLTSQIRRSAVSVPSNIAEGWGRQSSNDYIRFLQIARGSLFELNTQILLARDLGFLTDNAIITLVEEAQRILAGLIKSLQKRSATTPNR